jgi:FAD/FMN-containing dehydrogenase
MTTVRNFARTWRFTPAAVAYPTTVAELVAVVRGARKLRTVGSAHSWSTGIVTDATLVSLDKLCRVLEVDRAALRVTVQAGIKLKHLIRELEAHGLALANLGSIAEQSLAGAIATATHGTGLGFRCLASQVEAVKLIDGAGTERCYRPSDPAFAAVLTGLGCFGVVHELTLSVVPTFQMHAITQTARFDDVITELDARVRGCDHFKFWWLVPDDRVIVFENRRTDAPRDDSDLVRWLKDDLVAVGVYRTLVRVGRLHRRGLVPRINRFLTSQVGDRFERICKSHVGFLTPSPPVHREAEWAFPYDGAPALLRAYRDLLRGCGHTFNFIQEIRFTRADDFWLSPAYRRDSMWLSLYNIEGGARWDDQLRQFEAFARAHGGRPHWGKEATFDPAYLATQYVQLDAFRALMRAHDPDGKFVNPWVAAIFGR